ncbi:unconventional prefoldin RPB5 interactor-like protein [Thrips palmi]|uniref:Unconventional prefoldin RPB5 interactor-like protein n=1 Tax=Thrips palmi TaxID=161013 RepID=A0A6P8ZKX0_THRPL|nr:unconventional prefoldin RPB5 interactor-like protein [Thrips palmi]
MSLPPPTVGSNSLPNLPDKETLWQQTYLEAFHQNYDSVQRWTKWKEDHEQVKTTLSALPDKLSHEVVVPFGSKALMKAKLVHTNEVLTCIGSSWFVKQSAKQGIAMCERRIVQSEDMLKKLENERTLLTNRQTVPKVEEAFPSDGTEEIVEEYNEEMEAEWRRRHREREAEYHRKLAELRKRQTEQPPVQTEEDLFRRLDELELEEELNDELERLHAEYEADYENNDEEGEGESEGDEDEDSEGGSGDEMDENYSVDPRKVTLLNKPKSTNHNDGTRIVDIEEVESLGNDRRKNNDVSCSLQTSFASENCPELMKKNRRISFADETQIQQQTTKNEYEDESIYIRFNHSSELSDQMSRKTLEAPLETVGTPMYNTPADIFTVHKAQFVSPQPKSILKKSSSYPDKFSDKSQRKPVQSSASFGARFGMSLSDSDEDLASDEPRRDLSHLPPVLCNVQESSGQAPPASSQETSSRPVSRFKLARQGAKRQ